MDAFHEEHFDAMRDEGMRSGRSGATCIACLCDDDSRECDVAYVGDSRAILFDGTASPSGMTSVVASDITIDLPGERERVEARAGRIVGRNVFYGPVGIAMTRALGDAVMARAGVVPTPMVGNFQLGEGDTLLLATDGIWDVMTNDAVRDIALENDRAQEAADEIANAARQRWIADLPVADEVKADDITVVVVRCLALIL